MFTQDCNFIWVPVDENFVSLIQDLPNSDTPFPSERDLKGITGFLLVPAFLDTREIIFSPWMMQNEESIDIKGHFMVTARPENDGMIMMNYDPANNEKKEKNPKSLGVVEFKKTATVPGFQQNYAIYLKTGSAFILESLMRSSEWESLLVEDECKVSVRKLSNAHPSNKTISKKYWDGLDLTIRDLKEMFGAASLTAGYEIKREILASRSKEVYELLISLFRTNPKRLSELKFDKAIVDRCIPYAESELEYEFIEAIIKGIGNAPEKTA